MHEMHGQHAWYPCTHLYASQLLTSSMHLHSFKQHAALARAAPFFLPQWAGVRGQGIQDLGVKSTCDLWEGRAYNYFTACEHGCFALAAVHMCKHQSARAALLRLRALLHGGHCCGPRGQAYCLLAISLQSR